MHGAEQVVVIGAGIGGLASAVLLASRGASVTLVEKDSHAGGKVRRQEVGGLAIDAGPTVFTCKDVFEAIFAEVRPDLLHHHYLGLMLVRAMKIAARRGLPARRPASISQLWKILTGLLSRSLRRQTNQ